MDYGDSTILYKYQWDNIHDPESNFALFDEEGEGASEGPGALTNGIFDKYNNALPCQGVDKGLEIIGNKEFHEFILGLVVILTIQSDAGHDLIERATSQGGKKLVLFDSTTDLYTYTFNDDYNVLSFSMEAATRDLPEGDGRNGESLAQGYITPFAHELAHHKTEGPSSGYLIHPVTGYQTEILADEPYAVKMENKVRKDFGLPFRTDYGGVNVFAKKVQPSNFTGWFNLIHDDEYLNNYSSVVPSSERMRLIKSELKVCKEVKNSYSVGANPIKNSYKLPYYQMDHIILYH